MSAPTIDTKRRNLIAAIWSQAASVAKEDRDTFVHDVAFRVTRKKSLKDITNEGLHDILMELCRTINPNAATDRQRHAILTAAEGYGWDGVRLNKWIERQTGKTHLLRLSKAEATKVLNGFRALAASAAKGASK